MYKDFFQLEQLPFNLTPDPSFLFLLPRHREALAGLTYSILERKGFIVLTGDAGTGKTTLIHSVLSRLPADRIESSIVLNPTLTGSEFLEGVLLDFDIPLVPQSKTQRLWQLQEFLARTHDENRIAILVIDEAHNLSLEVLEEIRLLGNFESHSGKYLQILLSGQSELDHLLNRHELRQLKQRVAMNLYIDRLTPVEIDGYISFRWTKAGGRNASPFSRDAVADIVQWSQGIPRLINSLCDGALLMAFLDESPLVGVSYVRAAAMNLALADPAAGVPIAQSIGASPRVEKREKAQTLLQHKPDRITAAIDSGQDLTSPALSHYGDQKPNSSLLKRLAERFGLPR